MIREAARLGLICCSLIVVSLLPGCGPRDDPAFISASGHIEAREVRISAKVGGRLAEFPVAEGTHVTIGQVLARIDTVDVALALAAARAERDQATAELSLRLAGSRAEEIAEAEAQVARAQAERDGAERDLERMQGLLDRGSGTEKARDDARTRRDVAAAAWTAAREQFRRRRAGSRPQEIEAARARVAAAEARIDQYAQQMRDVTILSPLEGTITAKLAEPGELLAPGAGLCVITDLAHPWLTVYVAEPDLGRIAVGRKAEVRTDGGQSRTGTITFIAEEAEFTPKNVQTREERVKLVYRVKISLENADGLFKSGMPAEARLHARAPEDKADRGGEKDAGLRGSAEHP